MTPVERELRRTLSERAASVQPHAYAEAEFVRRIRAEPGSRRFRGSRLLVAVTAVFVATLALALTWLSTRTEAPEPGAVRPGEVPLTAQDVLGRWTLAHPPAEFAVGQGAVWTVDTAGVLSRIDPGSGSVTGSLRLPHWNGAGSLAAGLGSVWVGDPGDRSVLRIDATTVRVRARLTAPEPRVLCAGPFAVWVQTDAHTIASLDPADGTAVRRLSVSGPVTSLADDNGVLWAAIGGSLFRIASGSSTPVPLAVPVTTVAVTAGSIWAGGDGLVRLDRAGRVLASYHVHVQGPLASDHVATTMFFPTSDGALTAVDETAPPITIRVAGTPLRGLGVAFGSVWTATDRSLLRLRSFR